MPAIGDSSYSNYSVSRDCDRRLSRAAIRIVREHLGFVVERRRGARRHGAGLIGTPQQESLSDLLRKTNEELVANQDCPLMKDVMALHPEQFERIVPAYALRRFSSQLALSPTLYLTAGRNRGGRSKDPHQSGTSYPQFHQCALCGKTFITRYYLDRHLDLKHPEQFAASSSGCAAHCCQEFLSLQACHDAALEDEPFYGPGSGNHAPSLSTSRKTKHYWFQQAHELPCRQDEMRMVKARCQSVVHQCFPSNSTFAIDLERRMCGGLSCRHRLYRIFHRHSGGNGLLPLAWDAMTDLNHQHHHSWGVVGVVVLVLLVLVYVPCAILYWVRQNRLLRRHSWSTLPSRRRTSTFRSSGGGYTAVLDPKKRL